MKTFKTICIVIGWLAVLAEIGSVDNRMRSFKSKHRYANAMYR
jgi:hypothetical protein